jgi:hypothetical protein
VRLGLADFTDSGAPVANKARACVRKGQRNMCNPPRALVGLGEARRRSCDGRGGSARRSSPASVRACCSGHREGRKWGRARARCEDKPKQGVAVAVLSCRGACPGGAAAAEHRRAWSGHKGGLRPTGPSATGRAGPHGAHRGLGSTREVAQSGRRRGPSGGDGRRSWGRLMQGASGLLIPTGRLVVLLRRCHGG